MFEWIALALALGIKHSFDADHLAGVSTLLARSKSLRETIKMSASWALGHMVTATLITVLLFLLKDSLLSLVLDKMELLVAVMLIGLGAFSLYQARIFHIHPHEHIERKATSHLTMSSSYVRADVPEKTSGARHCYLPQATSHTHTHLHIKNSESEHSHAHMFGIGIVHGLASNDELLLLLTVSLGLTSLGDMILGVGIFSIGVVAGMVAFGIFLTYPILKLGSERLSRIVNAVAGSMSMIYGIWMLVG